MDQLSSNPLAYKIASQPATWVFDGLLSDRLLNHIDKQCDSTSGVTSNTDGRLSRTVTIQVDEISKELIDVLVALSGAQIVSTCTSIRVQDISGSDQHIHMDHINIQALRDPNPSTFAYLLDMSRLSSSEDENTVVPTFSFCVYLNNVGRCIFPLTGSSISSRRGRILMFQNYIDSKRPAHDPAAAHFGTYASDSKRIITAGMLSDRTPSQSCSSYQIDTGEGLNSKIIHRLSSFLSSLFYGFNRCFYSEHHIPPVQGIIYFPNGHDWNDHSRQPSHNDISSTPPLEIKNVRLRSRPIAQTDPGVTRTRISESEELLDGSNSDSISRHLHTSSQGTDHLFREVKCRDRMSEGTLSGTRNTRIPRQQVESLSRPLNRYVVLVIVAAIAAIAVYVYEQDDKQQVTSVTKDTTVFLRFLQDYGPMIFTVVIFFLVSYA